MQDYFNYFTEIEDRFCQRRRSIMLLSTLDWALIERLVLTRTIDSIWVEHLTELDELRQGIGLRGFAQEEPLNAFKKEAFELYEEMRGLIRHQLATTIFRVSIVRQPTPPQGVEGTGQVPDAGAAREDATAKRIASVMSSLACGGCEASGSDSTSVKGKDRASSSRDHMSSTDPLLSAVARKR